jgi:hypothetical protein
VHSELLQFGKFPLGTREISIRLLKQGANLYSWQSGAGEDCSSCVGRDRGKVGGVIAERAERRSAWALMEMLYRCGGLNHREIGEMLELDYSSVSVARKSYRVMANEDRKYLRLAERIESKLIQE